MAAETAEGGNMEATSEQWAAREGTTKRDCLVTRQLGIHCAPLSANFAAKTSLNSWMGDLCTNARWNLQCQVPHSALLVGKYPGGDPRCQRVLGPAAKPYAPWLPHVIWVGAHSSK